MQDSYICLTRLFTKSATCVHAGQCKYISISRAVDTQCCPWWYHGYRHAYRYKLHPVMYRVDIWLAAIATGYTDANLNVSLSSNA